MKKTEENIVRFKFDPGNPPRMTPEQQARLDAMTDEELTANALSDPDNPPLTEEDFAHMQWVGPGIAAPVKAMREKTGLTQKEFARQFGLPLATLKDWEQGRYLPDQAARNLLKVIAYAPDVVREALKS